MRRDMKIRLTSLTTAADMSRENSAENLKKAQVPAKMWRDDIGNVDIVDATEEGRSNDHQYKHEPKQKQKAESFH